jgi:hypothetical protein
MTEPASTTLLLGARYLCPACLGRGFRPTCPCGRPATDLTTVEGAALLSRARKSKDLEPTRPSLLRWWKRQTTAARVEWVIAFVGALGLVSWVLGSSQPGDGSERWLAIPFFFLFFLLLRVIAFLGDMVLRLLGVLVLLVAALILVLVEGLVLRRKDARLSTATLELIQRMLDFGARSAFVSHPLREPHPTARLVGRLSTTEEAQPTFSRYEGRAGNLVFADAMLDPFEIALPDGELVRVEPDVGAVIVASPPPKASRRKTERASLDAPSWLPAKVARAPEAFASGKPVGLAGGRWGEAPSALGTGEDFRRAPTIRVLRGTAEEPLYVDFTVRESTT